MRIDYGRFSSVRIYEEREVLPKVKEHHLEVYFSDFPHGDPRFTVRYTPVMALTVPGATVGDLLDVTACITTNGYPFYDFRTGERGSAFAPTVLTLDQALPPDDGELHGSLFGNGAGENVNLYRPYIQIPKCGVVKVFHVPAVVIYWLLPRSTGGKAPQHLSLMEGWNQNVLTVRHYKP